MISVIAAFVFLALQAGSKWGENRTHRPEKQRSSSLFRQRYWESLASIASQRPQVCSHATNDWSKKTRRRSSHGCARERRWRWGCKLGARHVTCSMCVSFFVWSQLLQPLCACKRDRRKIADFVCFVYLPPRFACVIFNAPKMFCSRYFFAFENRVKLVRI